MGPAVSTACISTQAALGIALHAAAVIALLALPWQFDEDMTWVALAVPVSQNSLIALWASTSTRAIHVRFLVAVIAIWSAWFQTISMLDATPSGEVSAGWAGVLCVQSAFIVAAVSVTRVVQTRFSRHQVRRAYRYSFRTLFIWLTIIAILMSIFRIGPGSWNWIEVGADWAYFAAVPILGAYHGLYGIVFLAAVAYGPRSARSVLPTIVLVGLLAITEPLVLSTVMADAGGATMRTALLSASAQLAILFGTVWILDEELSHG